MKNIFYILIALSCIGASTCRPTISTPIVATAQAQDEFPKVEPSELLAAPPEAESEKPAQADVKPQTPHPIDISAAIMNYIAFQCQQDGNPNHECEDATIPCVTKLDANAPGVLLEVRKCAAKNREGK